MRYLTLLAIVSFFLFGCTGPHDPVSEQSAAESYEGLQLDLNGGNSPEQVEAIIRAAFDLAAPTDLEDREEVFARFDEKVRELVLSDISVKIALARAKAWLRYEQSKRPAKPGDISETDENGGSP